MGVHLPGALAGEDAGFNVPAVLVVPGRHRAAGLRGQGLLAGQRGHRDHQIAVILS